MIRVILTVLLFGLFVYPIKAQKQEKKEKVHILMGADDYKTPLPNNKGTGIMIGIEQFEFYPDKHKVDTLNASCLNKVKLYSIKELWEKEQRIIEKKNQEYQKELGIIYPPNLSHEFFDVYVLEKVGDKVLRYQVYWEYTRPMVEK